MSNNNLQKHSIVMMGATGAVGTQVVISLLRRKLVERLTLLGRSDPAPHSDAAIIQHKIDVRKTETYRDYLPGHTVAICTLGIGQPTRVSRREFKAIDHDAVFDFAKSCRKAGVRHFQLLSAVGANRNSNSFYLKSKGELEKSLQALKFERLSLFRPSMILTPENRYGKLQGLALTFWPKLDAVFTGPFQRLRGISVEKLGDAIAANVDAKGKKHEILEWKNFQKLSAP